MGGANVIAAYPGLSAPPARRSPAVTEHAMLPGSFTGHFDAVQIIVAAFFAFFLGLVYYLRREDKREGYPLVDISPVGRPIEGFPMMPPPKIYTLLEGGTTQMPHYDEPSEMRAAPLLRFPGAPLVPIGDAMFAEVGPGAYPKRKDKPFMAHGFPQVRPLRVALDWKVAHGDPDPRGMRVQDASRREVGTVVDLWVDRAVKILRYLEVELDSSTAGKPVLLPIYHAAIRPKRRVVLVNTLLAGDFHGVPRTAHPEEITAREEDQVNAYYAGAQMYGRGRQGGIVTEITPAPRVVG